VPADGAFTTKPKLGRRMLERAFKAGVPCAWVAGDSVYGSDSGLRRDCERRSVGYVLAVTSAQRLGLSDVARWAAAMPVDAWQRLSAGDGAKGPRLFDWAYAAFQGSAPPGWRKGLLVRRSIAEPDELTFDLTLAPPDTELATLVRVAGTRWTVEACFEAATGEVGLDEYEVRSWTGWHRHMTLAMLAHAYLAVVRKAAVGGREQRRSRLGAPAPYRARGAPAALAARLGPRARARCRSRLVTLASAPPAACPPLSWAQANTPP
jgi:SRSO17 transposase